MAAVEAARLGLSLLFVIAGRHGAPAGGLAQLLYHMWFTQGLRVSAHGSGLRVDCVHASLAACMPLATQDPAHSAQCLRARAAKTGGTWPMLLFMHSCAAEVMHAVC